MSHTMAIKNDAIYMLKSIIRHPLYNYFVERGGIEAARKMGCQRHGPDCVRCRWGGNGFIRGTKAEAAGFRSLDAAIKARNGDIYWKVVIAVGGKSENY
jgi:hypothetical protein